MQELTLKEFMELSNADKNTVFQDYKIRLLEKSPHNPDFINKMFNDHFGVKGEINER